MDEHAQVTVTQAAKRLGISRYQVYRRIMRGDLRATKSRNSNIHWVINTKDLDNYIAAGGADVLSEPRPLPRLDDTLRVPEVALLTGYSAETIRRMCRDGSLPYRKGTGRKGHFHIPRSAVEKLSR